MRAGDDCILYVRNGETALTECLIDRYGRLNNGYHVGQKFGSGYLLSIKQATVQRIHKVLSRDELAGG